MSYSSQALEMDHILRDIHKVDGLIATEPQGRDHPVFPCRDKRKRPVIWDRAGELPMAAWAENDYAAYARLYPRR